MFTKSKTRGLVAFSAFALVGLAGCDLPPQGAPGAAAPTSGTVDACSVVPVAVVNTVLGINDPGKPQLGDGTTSCHWENASTSSSMDLEIGAPGSAAGGTVPAADSAEPIPNGDGVEGVGKDTLRFAVRDRLCTLRIDAGNVNPDLALRLAQGIRAATVASLPAADGSGAAPVQVPPPAQASASGGQSSEGPSTVAGKTIYYEGFKITLGDVAQSLSDNGKPVIEIPVTYENIGASTSYVTRPVDLASAGSHIQYSDSLQVPGGAKSAGKLSFNVDPSFTLNDAVLTFGGADKEQAVVPLGDTGQVVALEPAPLAVAGTVQAGSLTVTVKSGELRADAPPDNVEVPRGKRYLHLVLDAVRTDVHYPSNLSASDFVLVMPNGAKANPENVQIISSILTDQTPARDLNCWFIVDTPTAGQYQLTVAGPSSGATVLTPFQFTVS